MNPAITRIVPAICTHQIQIFKFKKKIFFFLQNELRFWNNWQEFHRHSQCNLLEFILLSEFHGIFSLAYFPFRIYVYYDLVNLAAIRPSEPITLSQFDMNALLCCCCAVVLFYSIGIFTRPPFKKKMAFHGNPHTQNVKCHPFNAS